MADIILPGAQPLSEWFSAVGGAIIGCGEAAALVAVHVVNGEPISTDELTQTIKSAIASGNAQGAAHGQTAPNVQWDLSQHGIQSTAVYDPAGIADALRADAGVKPLVLGVSYGAALPEESPGLRGHYVTVVGRGSDGTFLLADPNTTAATKGQFTRATFQQLMAAQPFAAITPTGSSRMQDGSTLQGGSSSGFDVAGAINSAVQSLTQSATIGLERAGLLLLALAIVAFGVILLAFPALESGARTAAKVA